jgi:type IV secretion system protein VirB10
MSELPPVSKPSVAKPDRPVSLVTITIAVATLGIATFSWLSNARAARTATDGQLPGLAATSVADPVPLAADPPPAPPPPPPPQMQPAPQSMMPPPMPILSDDRERFRAPALIVDLAQANAPAMPVPGEPRPASGGGPASGSSGLSDTERFSARVGGEEVDVVSAERMTGLDRMIPQGAIIGAVMETALNSDLPGFARALVQRDVLSFDGSAVLIPAGSRVIGQYKSGVAQGASRVFILWTRVIRPDGVSIAIASPAVDDLGRGGVTGKVNRHFLQRFGGAILMSVLTGGITTLANSVNDGSTIIVGTAGQATQLAGEATGSSQIPPTIVTAQGSPVRIFVARDLDFTKVGPYQ